MELHPDRIYAFEREERQRVEEFRIAAEEFTKQHTVSREAAIALLVAEGFITPDGKLTKEYGGE